MDYLASSHSAYTGVNDGLTRFMALIYAKLAGGLALSAVIAWIVTSQAGLSNPLFLKTSDGEVGLTNLGLLLLWSPLLLLFLASFVINDRSRRGAGALYWTIAALLGGSLGVLAMNFSVWIMAFVFALTAAIFVSLSVVALTAKRTFNGYGNLAFVALPGLIATMLVNLFLHSPTADFLISGAGVLIFAGLIAYDTQRLHDLYEREHNANLGVATDFGVLSLYLDVLNLFQLLMALSGHRTIRR